MRWRALPALALLLTACTAEVPQTGQPPTSPSPVSPAVLADVGPLVAGVTQRTPKELPAPRLAEGLTPPTNRWYSGLVFGDQPEPVFPLPLGFALTADGFAFGLPRVTAGPSTISGGFVADVSVGLGAARSMVSSSDASVVVLDSFAADGGLIGHTTIAQGSPFVSFVAAADTTLTIPAGFTPAGDGIAVATIGGVRYALSAGQVDGDRVVLNQGEAATFWPVPEGHDPAELAGRTATVTGSNIRYEADGDNVTTTLAYSTAGGRTAIARMPHQASEEACDLGSYASIYGELQLCAGESLTWSTPQVRPGAELDLTGLSAQHRSQLGTQLDADIAALPAFPADTYFGGKALQRTAMLLMVAEQLELPDRADRLAGVLDEQLTRWTEPQGCAERDAFCFVYDPQGKGMVGLTPSFGSDEYNDHHFHYGYFLYAAAVLARHDPAPSRRVRPRDEPARGRHRRLGEAPTSPTAVSFDSYAGHSWASGTSPFADGNNQESVVRGRQRLGRALAVGPGHRGQRRWRRRPTGCCPSRPDRRPPTGWSPTSSAFSGYSHRIVPLNWGGKRDYATWFSAEPAAMLGIVLLPMSPTSTYLAGSPDAIRANVAEAVGGEFDQKFGDYILMYAALAGREDRDRALAAAQDLSEESIDDGMSRTYLLAWLLSVQT